MAVVDWGPKALALSGTIVPFPLAGSRVTPPMGPSRQCCAVQRLEKHPEEPLPLPMLSVLLPSPAGLFIFIWLVVLYYPKMEETTSSLSHITKNDRTMAVSQG